MKRTLTYEQALHKIAALCVHVEKCESDVREKLNSWGISEKEADEIIAYLKKEKFLDNHRFAIAFAKDKFRYNKWGKIKIAYALRNKKISENSITKALSEIDDNDNIDSLTNILNAKLKLLKYKDEYDRKAKLIRFALSRGFEIESINSSLKNIGL